MSEVKVAVRTVKVDYACEKCKIGFMRPSGAAWGMPQWYSHACNNPACDAQDSFECCYPRIEYVPEEASPSMVYGNVKTPE